MGINQAIFTSSSRGIDRGGGLGVYSYNRECSSREISEFEQGYCSYVYKGRFEKVPFLPTKMVFGKVGNDRYMQAEVTYLGLDYDKVSGRMGNCLSHMISYGEEDVDVYPLQLYGSPDYRRNMAVEEVDGTVKVDYLPTLANVRCGNVVDIGQIQNFLEEDGRLDFFCHLLAAVIARGQMHKVIIYDRHENIVMWMAAIEYALPLSCARTLSFSTYEYRPMMSEFDLRGAVPGLSEGDCETYAESGQFYVFDGISGKYPKFDINSDFFQYGIQMGMSFAYESLEAFHRFLKGYHYAAVNPDLYDGFMLYQMVPRKSDVEDDAPQASQGGMETLSEEEIHRAISFEQKYGSKKSYLEMLDSLVKRLSETGGQSETILVHIRSLLTAYYGKQLNADEFQNAVRMTIAVEKSSGESKEAVRANREMWRELFRVLAKKDPAFSEEFARCMIIEGLFSVLGDFCSFLIRGSRAERLSRRVEWIYMSYWEDVPAEEKSKFDVVVKTAVEILAEGENGDCGREAMSLFLKLQTVGDGMIAGSGMEQLICLIADHTSLVEEKHGLAALRRHNDEDSALVRLQTRCALETFNYSQKFGVNLPIAPIRLKHLGRAIEKAYEDGMELEKSKAVAIYTKFPVDVFGVDREEFAGFVRQILTTAFAYDNTKENYRTLLSCWRLDEADQDMLFSEIMDREIRCVKKEENGREMEALFAAVEELGDSGYRDAIVRALSGVKASQRDKVTEILAMSGESGSDVFKIWKKLNRTVSMQEARAPKKGFLNLKKH